MLLCRQLPSRRISLLVAALRMNPRSTNCLNASLATFSEQLQCDGLDAGPAKFFLPGAADQIAVYRQRDRFQVIAEDGIAYLIESFTENRHRVPPCSFRNSENKILRSGSLSVRLSADGICVFRNAACRRTVAAVSAAFLLLRTLYADHTHLLYKNSWAARRTGSYSAALFVTHGVSFRLSGRACCLTAEFWRHSFRQVSALVVGMQLSRYNRGQIEFLIFLTV